MNQSKTGLNNWFLILAVLALAIAPLILVRDGEFAGADGQAEAAITEIQPGYKPWFKPFFEPASGEIASLLFASQAALGAGLVGYAIGVYKGRSQQQKSEE
ncbi:energy-coupling factor ABC transporter substrate-binding protein [Anabaena sp. UHCC 0253]|uniref:energy-coupling factor ABC transporter substrate-binding protein n=1 Tax=Anabaena sp. UHCC 0253 TaxID=2590019 RepID=UPI001447C2EA|nr:energy-coupling factor ABC transporter substrate-binding protein [Anabaena sp. UHCC 0253]MTJ51898.1 energy-coupling factor ABC transporter substrate-binding protein [Anabaena sp. UHCC 0253]